jgi:type VI secretion system secreted protein VgrG
VRVGGDQSTTIGSNRSELVALTNTLTVGKSLRIEAGDEVEIAVGESSIVMRKDGTILIKGRDITIEAAGKVIVNAGGDITLKGSRVLQN